MEKDEMEGLLSCNFVHEKKNIFKSLRPGGCLQMQHYLVKTDGY